MLIEAELDDLHSQRLQALQQRLQKPIAEIAAVLLAQAIDGRIESSESEGQKMLRIFAEEGLLGGIQEDSGLSVSYKQQLWDES